MELNFDIHNPENWKILAKKRHSNLKDELQFTPSREFWDEISKDYDDLENCSDYLNMMHSIIDKLRYVGALKDDSKVLDIGCGTGNYAVKFSPFVKEILCIDISEKMIEILKNKINSLNIKNIKTLHCDWCEIDIDKLRLKGEFDLVFASMTPLTSDLNQIDKMLECSKKYLCIVSWAGVKENNVIQEVMQRLWNKTTRKAPDMIITFNYLYSLGFAPQLEFYHGTWQKTKDLDNYLSYLIKILNNIKKLENSDIIKVKEYLKSISKDGVITSHTKVRIASMLVDVNKKKG